MGRNGVRPVVSVRSADVHMGVRPANMLDPEPSGMCCVDVAADESISRNAVGDSACVGIKDPVQRLSLGIEVEEVEEGGGG
jgi:hypothetical protein